MISLLVSSALRLPLGHPNRSQLSGFRPSSGPSRQLHVNGKWLVHSSSAHRRYAAEMVRALAATGHFELILHVPADADPGLCGSAAGGHVEIRRAGFTGWVFEQIYLPAVTADRVVLNFTGTAPLLKRRQLVTMHDATPFRRPSGFRRSFVRSHLLAYRWLGRVADGLSTETVYTAHELSDVLHIDVDGFIVAGGAADSLRQVRPIRPELPLFGDHYLMIGTAAEHENISVAAAALANSGRRVVIVGLPGSGRMADASVVYAEHVTDAELVWLYRHAQAFVLPCSYAGFGLSALEAQALGCPVVCADTAALPEVCGDAALYFDPDDPDTLTAQLDRLDSEIALADDLRRRGFANSARYSWTESAERVIEWVRARPDRAMHR